MKLKGVVLAGGKSSRFGSDKALASWKGKTLLEHAVDLLTELNLETVVLANREKDYSFLSCPVYFDLLVDKGPLGGILSACLLFSEQDFLILTCDMPFIKKEILNQLVETHSEENQITIFGKEDLLEPFPGIYKNAVLQNIQQQFLSNDLSIKSLILNTQKKQIIEISQGINNFFLNINHLDSLRALES